MEIRQNSLKAWLLAARPKTLSAALVPVAAAAALAWHDGVFSPVPFLLCVVFASLMQVAANFINDLYDFLSGTDGSDRLGPERACAQGWIAPAAMKRGIACVVACALLAGLALLAVFLMSVGAGVKADFVLPLLLVGAGCVVGAFLYSRLSHDGLGDVLVLLFFGLVPVGGTYFVQAGRFTNDVWLLGFACGLVIDTLLVLNNYRDRDTDRSHGKMTLVARFGESFGHLFYFFLGVAGALLTVFVGSTPFFRSALLMLPYLAFHVSAWTTMREIRSGRELNRVLGLTSRNILLYGLLAVLSFLL